MTDEPINTTDSQPSNDDSQRLTEHMSRMAVDQFRRDMKYASQLLSSGKSKEAIPLLVRCLEFSPDDVNVLTNLGGAYILAEKHRHAIPHLERATELAPENPSVWSNLAAAYLGKLVTATSKRQAKALEAYQRVIELDAGYPNVHYNMGLIFIDRREWDNAYDAFTRAIEHAPHDQDAHAMRNKVDEIRNRPAAPSNN